MSNNLHSLDKYDLVDVMDCLGGPQRQLQCMVDTPGYQLQILIACVMVST